MTEKTLLSQLADELETISGWPYRLRNETEDVARTVLAFLSRSPHTAASGTETLVDRVRELEEALRPFAAIRPSTIYAADGTECEKYASFLSEPHQAHEFTGLDLARARKALGNRHD